MIVLGGEFRLGTYRVCLVDKELLESIRGKLLVREQLVH